MYFEHGLTHMHHAALNVVSAAWSADVRTRRKLTRHASETTCLQKLALHCFPAVGVTAFHSGLHSHHCKECPVLPALFPAWTSTRIMIYQATPGFPGVPLQSPCSEGAGRPHGAQDVQPSAPLRQLNPHERHRETLTSPDNNCKQLLGMNLQLTNELTA